MIDENAQRRAKKVAGNQTRSEVLTTAHVVVALSIFYLFF